MELDMRVFANRLIVNTLILKTLVSRMNTSGIGPFSFLLLSGLRELFDIFGRK